MVVSKQYVCATRIQVSLTSYFCRFGFRLRDALPFTNPPFYHCLGCRTPTSSFLRSLVPSVSLDLRRTDGPMAQTPINMGIESIVIRK